MTRGWLPFVVRMHFYAGQESVWPVHTIISDGDGVAFWTVNRTTSTNNANTPNTNCATSGAARKSCACGAPRCHLERAWQPWLRWLGRHRASGCLEGRRISSGL